MKNIYLIPTDKLSKLYLHSNGEIQIRTELSRTDGYLGNNQHIYITSDVEIKEGEKCITFGSDKCKGQLDTFQSNVMYSRKPQKIILTTDGDLIKDGVQAIDDTFLEWFIKNSSCEEVIVEIDYNKFFKKGNITISNCYEIIIPKEPIKK
jgi:hypothetical protein